LKTFSVCVALCAIGSIYSSSNDDKSKTAESVGEADITSPSFGFAARLYVGLMFRIFVRESANVVVGVDVLLTEFRHNSESLVWLIRSERDLRWGNPFYQKCSTCSIVGPVHPPNNT
jgi:hypothetical protein